MNKIKATVSTFTEYWNAIYELSMQAKRKNLVLLYRGHGDRKYKCQPGIFRESNKNLDEQYQYNKIILTIFIVFDYFIIEFIQKQIVFQLAVAKL